MPLAAIPRKDLIRCQIGDLKIEVTCYVIDADTSYNILLEHPLIHANMVVPQLCINI